MYIFIDESGVHKEHGRSSIALVYITINNIEAFQEYVMETEKNIGITNFHWAHSTWSVRKKFIDAIVKKDFSVKVALIQNPFHVGEAYEYALQHLVIERDILSVVIDGKKNKSYERRLRKVLRDKGISTKKLRLGNDTSFPALRVADAIAGIVRYKDEHPESEKIQYLFGQIASKISITLEE